MLFHLVTHLVIEELGDMREELEAEVQFNGFVQNLRSYAAASIPAHLTSLGPQTHLTTTQRERHRDRQGQRRKCF